MNNTTMLLIGILALIIGGAWYYGNVMTKPVVSEANTTIAPPYIPPANITIPIPVTNTTIPVPVIIPVTNTTIPIPTTVTNTTIVNTPPASPSRRNYNVPPPTPYIPYSPPVYTPPPQATNTTLPTSSLPTTTFPEFGSSKDFTLTDGTFTFTDDRNLPNLVNPTEAQMQALLTTANLPGQVSGQCKEYSLALRQASNSAGYRCAIVCLSLSTLENTHPILPIHALNAFQTTDRGLIYIEPQDSSVRIIGKNLEYNPGKNLTDDFIKLEVLIW